MDILVELLSLLLIAILIATAVKYIRVPYTIALVLVGIAVGLSGLFPPIQLTEELVFTLILPPLLFEGALAMDIGELRRNLKPILSLATLGLVISILVTGYITSLAGLPLLLALIFAAMASPTDPVSVLATFKKLGAPRKLTTIMEGESIINDGTAVVIYSILFGMLEGTSTLSQGVIEFFFVCVGGAIVGFLLGHSAHRLLRHIDDALIEVTLTVILAFGTFLVAESLGVSGVIAVVSAGLIVGNYGTEFSMSPTTRITLVNFWSAIVFIVNSLVFILIGLDTPVYRLADNLWLVGLAILAVLAGRAFVVYPTLTAFRMNLSWQNIVFWGGLHGTIPVALALSYEGPMREELVSMVFGVVIFSLVVQGLSLDIYARRVFRRDVRKAEYEVLRARLYGIRKAMEEVSRMASRGEIDHEVAAQIIERLGKMAEGVKAKLSEVLGREEIRDEEYRKVWREVLEIRRSAVSELIRKGIVGEDAGGRVIREIDEELIRLEGGESE
ncbi:Na+/H+ antiporter [Geoglobus acetivorans]|uniref:Na+/H+ antiporter n=1 Tax=Geoglobus acetivorans TaxID=565033 RepID=A0ABZ3H1D7_GEOAI|nr:Na+/H+ antiporter [Geoglobus acetivorans]